MSQHGSRRRSRREFLHALTASALGAPLLARCAAPVAPRSVEIPRIAHFSIATEREKTGLQDLLAGLADFGYREGETILIEYRWAGTGDAKVAGQLADELIAIPGLRLFTCAGNATVRALKERTMKPIVMGSSPDPIENKLVANLARPGGNVTGVATVGAPLVGKRVELLKELVPSMTVVGLLHAPSTAGGGRDGGVAAAKDLALRPEIFEVADLDQLEVAFQRAVDIGVQAMAIGPETFNLDNRRQINALAARYRLPSVHAYADGAREGGLAAISINAKGILRGTGKFVDRILKGASPADLPVELWTGGELRVNLSTARALGLTIPAAVLSRATEVIP